MGRRWIALACMALACAASGGCGREPAPAPSPVTQAAPAPAAPAADPLRAQLRPGDVIQVEVLGQPDLNRAAVVRPDGKVALVLLGDVAVVDMTSAEAAEKLTRLYREYIVGPVVTVTRILDQGTREICVFGQVKQAGPQPWTPDMKLLDALSKAGGVTGRADLKAVQVVRQGKVWKVDIEKIVVHGTGQNVPLEPDDTIFVPLDASQRGRSPMSDVFYPSASFPKSDQAKPDPATDGAWGEAVGGIQVRLVADRTQWKAGEVPRLVAETRDLRERGFGLTVSGPALLLEIDGVVYAPARSFHAESLPIPAGRFDSVSIALDPEKWVNEGKTHPALKPGKHTVRVTLTASVPRISADDDR